MKNGLLLIGLVLTCLSFTSIDSSKTNFVSVFDEPQIVEMNMTLNTLECNNKYYLPIDLPSGATGMIYSVTTISKREANNPKSVLLKKVIDLAKKNEPAKLVDFINHNHSKRSFNLYVLQKKENAESFFNCGHFEYTKKYISTKSRSSYIEKLNGETFFIGIENNRDLKKLRLKIEVVAVI